MQFHRNELFLLYHPHTSTGKQTKALALTINSHVHEVDALHEKLGPTYWKEVITLLGLTPKELLDRSNPQYQSKVAGNTYTMQGWLEVLMHNPELLKAPVAIYNGKAVLCQTPTDIFKLTGGKHAEEAKTMPHLKQR